MPSLEKTSTHVDFSLCLSMKAQAEASLECRSDSGLSSTETCIRQSPSSLKLEGKENMGDVNTDN